MASILSNGLWRECAAWLTRCRAIPANHIVNSPESEIGTLAFVLRDGVILCNLLNIIDPKAFTTKSFNSKPQMAQFLCLQNIDLFLEICKNDYGLDESDLFEPNMLYEYTNFDFVLTTLSKLSQRIAQNFANLPGFSLRNSLQNKLYDESDYEKFYTSMESEYCYILVNAENAKHEEVYQKLCAPKPPTQPSPSMSQRDYVIREVLETERKYVNVLDIINSNFMDPMEKYLSLDELNAIFPKIKELTEIHHNFLARLENEEQLGFKGLCTTFLEFKEHLLVYGEFCVCLPKCQDALIRACNQKPILKQCLKEGLKDLQVFEFYELLAVPFQRFLKYPLFVDRLIKNTPSTYENYDVLEKARDVLRDVNRYSEGLVKESQEADLINNCQKQICDLDLPDGNCLRHYGRYLLDGEVSVKSDQDREKRPAFAFLFEKILIMTKNCKNGMYSFFDAFKLNDHRIETNCATGTGTLSREERFTLRLVHKEESRASCLYLKNGTLRNKWLRTIQNAIENLEPIYCLRSDHKFELTTFDSPTTCHQCENHLMGMISQGFKCQFCDICVHKECISSAGHCMKKPSSPYSEQLSHHCWFVGIMSRQTATNKLLERKTGTFLVRVRRALNSRESIYSIGLRTDTTATNMKIYKKDVQGITNYCLSRRRYFKSISELIAFHQINSLEESFSNLKICLLTPFDEVHAKALHNFTPNKPNQLALKKGNKVLVLSKDADQNGWWRGRSGKKVGYFPMDFVEVVPQRRPSKLEVEENIYV